MTYLIMDVRGNSGGYLDQAVMVSDMFLPKDAMIVYMEGAHRSREEFRASGRGKYQDLKLAILIDEGTASAAEIISGYAGQRKGTDLRPPLIRKRSCAGACQFY